MNTEEHDSAGAQHFGLYGCSDKANARCNQNPDFQEGFRQGMLDIWASPADQRPADRD